MASWCEPNRRDSDDVRRFFTQGQRDAALTLSARIAGGLAKLAAEALAKADQALTSGRPARVW